VERDIGVSVHSPNIFSKTFCDFLMEMLSFFDFVWASSEQAILVTLGARFISSEMLELKKMFQSLYTWIVAYNSLSISTFSAFFEFCSSFSLHLGFSCILYVCFNEFELLIKKIKKKKKIDTSAQGS
jgi:hypothetical protein